MINLVTISKQKLLEAGYKFLRADDYGGSIDAKPLPKIKVCERFGAWTTLKVFNTKKERDAEMRRMVEEPGSIYLTLE